MVPASGLDHFRPREAYLQISPGSVSSQAVGKNWYPDRISAAQPCQEVLQTGSQDRFVSSVGRAENESCGPWGIPASASIWAAPAASPSCRATAGPRHPPAREGTGRRRRPCPAARPSPLREESGQRSHRSRAGRPSGRPHATSAPYTTCFAGRQEAVSGRPRERRADPPSIC